MKHHVEAVQDAYEIISQIHGYEELKVKLFNTIKEMEKQNEALLPNWVDLKKPIMAIDFDGVISEYKQGWQGEAHNLEGERPVTGAIDFISNAIKHFKVLIFSSRCNSKLGQLAIEKWLIEYGLTLKVVEQITFQAGKPSYHVIIDDRAFRFTGTFMDPKELIKFRPWYYGFEGWRAH